MNRRRAIAVLALLGALDSLYLLLHKMGHVGTLACTPGGACEVVNTSEYSVLFGLPVPLYGLVGYLTLLGIALAGARPGAPSGPMIDRVLAGLAGTGTAFSLYLTYISLFVIGTACPWCLVSLALITAIFGLALVGVLGGRRRSPVEPVHGMQKAGSER